MVVEIDDKSGFCFGVVRAITEAERALGEGGTVYSLGDIVRTLVVPEFRMIQLLHDYYGIDERWRFTDTHRPERPPVVPPDKDQAVARLEAAETRDEVVEATLALCHHYFRRVVFFIVREPWLLGWTGAGEGMDEGLAQGLRIPLDQPSIFRAVARDKTFFVGRPGPEPENERFARALEGILAL